MDPIDLGLERLRATARARNLDGLERAVFARLDGETRSDVFRGRLIPVQIAVCGAALIVGLGVAHFTAAPQRTLQSEAIVLSDDIAPSVRLHGDGA